MRKIIFLRVFHVIILVLIAGSIGYFLGTNKVKFEWKNYTPVASVLPLSPPLPQNLNMALFYQILDKINHGYYDKSKISADKLLNGAINGMLSSLEDPYTSFFPPKQNSDFKSQLAGEFSGIGAELSATQDNKIVVIAPLDGSPAERAGILAGDIVVKVNGESTDGWTVSQAVDKIRGPKGSEVALLVAHDKDKKQETIKIVRDTIVIKSVTSWVKNFSCSKDDCEEVPTGAKVVYIRLSQFGDKTNDEWVSTVNSVNDKIRNDKNFKGIILDLRNNPGGYLNDAVFIASEFLKDGVVVLQEDATKQHEALSVSKQGAFTDYPVIVLINKGSASAAEIVSGALRDHGRAKLL